MDISLWWNKFRNKGIYFIFWAISWIIWEVLTDELCELIRAWIPEGGVLMFVAAHPYLIMPILLLPLAIWAYIQSKKEKILSDAFALEDALAMIDTLGELFMNLMSATDDKIKANIRMSINNQINNCPNDWIREQIRLFLNAVVEGVELGIPSTTPSSQAILTEWSARMSKYAYRHFRKGKVCDTNQD